MPATLLIKPWNDPVVDTLGHDPRSRYVETFWLPTLGPPSVAVRTYCGLGESPVGGRSIAVLLLSESAEFGCSHVPGYQPARHCTEQGRHHQADPERCRHLGDEESDLRFLRVLDDEDQDQHPEHDAEDQTWVQASLAGRASSCSECLTSHSFAVTRTVPPLVAVTEAEHRGPCRGPGGRAGVDLRELSAPPTLQFNL